MTPEETGTAIERLGAQFRVAAREAVQDTLYAMHSLAYEYSSGPHSSAELRHMDSPFAVRHGEPLLPPEILNVQSGELRNSWMTEGPLDSGGTIRGSIWNSAPYAVFLESGTSTAFRRPIADEVQVNAEPIFQAAVERRMSEVLHG